MPWLVFIWCIAHRLELALSDTLSTSEFADVNEMLLRMYYLYKKAPKKLNQLREMHGIYKQTLDFEIGDCKPKKANGTRWISHKLEAVKMCLDKWSLYIEQNTWSTFLVIKVSQVKRQKMTEWHEMTKNGIDDSHFYRLVRNPFVFITCFPKGKNRECVNHPCDY